MMKKIIKKITVYGNPFIGIYAKTNDKITLTGKSVVGIFEKNKDAIKTRVIETSIANSDLIGIYSAMNNKGVILPFIIWDKEISEIKEIKKLGINVSTIETKLTAIGNNIAANDNACIINPRIKEKKIIKNISETLDVEVIPFKVANFLTVGATTLVTNKGFITHPNASYDEIKEMESIFKVKGGVGTANKGVPFIPLSIIANSNGFLAGELTTGYELGRISESLDLIGMIH